MATGRKADIGRSLGVFTSSAVSIEGRIDSIRQFETTNGFTQNRLATMQIGLDAMVDGANTFISQMTAEISGSLDKFLLQTIGQSALEKQFSVANVSFRGEYVFSGINTDTPALVDYHGASGAPARAAVQSAFSGHFGFSVNDPAAQSISPAALKSFIDGPFRALFDDANWQALWTGGSDQGLSARISEDAIVQTPTTIQASAFRSYTQAVVLVSEFVDGQLKPSAIDQLANSALELMAAAVVDTGEEQSKLGTVEERVESVTDRLALQRNVLGKQLSELTDVDAYEAVTRLNRISISLEATYAVTARIQSLSLMNYI